ncbi:pyrimidine reductase family protein [Microlunatus panaciterrae]|uniref:Riboflavin biosynthesis pyrimidine reductase n=1 Tax=Microlunatus panaciterrae TaxID=400768 RepID=A0ABS2RQ24_9ACTN|nr:dihydrofolate reductase family protein [Microlunatus panaciterrae]MBM7800697.1 riboflavin biosynthesis pyrimidine reductase [Microlunatus panaciterrae]
MQQLFGRSDGIVGMPLDDLALRRLYRHPLPTGDSHWLRTNFVATLDGSAQGPDERSGTINTPSDQHVFALQRAHADAVIAGAGTVRKERYRAVDLAPWQQEVRRSEDLSPVPTLVVVTRSLDLSLEMATAPSGSGGRVMIMTTTDHRPEDLRRFEQAGFDLLQVGSGSVDLAAGVDLLVASGYRRLLCEGGATLHHALLAADLLDEMCLTLAPTVIGGPGQRTVVGPLLNDPRAFALEFAMLADDGALFTSYHRHR